MAVHSRRNQTPPVRVTEADYDALADLAEALRGDGAALLRQELERAHIVRDGRHAPVFAQLGSWVEYRDLISGRAGRVQLTLPKDADIDAGRLSVATPMGAALFGLRLGDAFAWTGADGRRHAVTVDGIGEGASSLAGAA